MKRFTNTHHLSASSRTAWTSLGIMVSLVGCADPIFDDVDTATTATRSDGLTSGADLASYQGHGYFTAVGKLPGCSATLVSHEVVLTAGHCVCPDTTGVGCQTRGSFELRNVRPADNPATTWIDESDAPPTNVTIAGNVVIHPDLEPHPAGLPVALEDYAIIKLDVPAYTVAADVVPMRVAGASRAPGVGDHPTVAGYGQTGPDCLAPPAADGLVSLTHVFEVVEDAIRIDLVRSCPGDSGGPMFDIDQYVLGVASWADLGGTGSTYRPTFESDESPGWIQDAIDEMNTSSDAAHFDVSKGTSWSLGADSSTYANHDPEVGIVGVAVSPVDGSVYTWYVNGTYSVGRTYDLREYVEQERFSVAPGHWPEDIVGMGVASSGNVYTWYDDGTVSVGAPHDLDSIASPYGYGVAPGRVPSDLVGVDIATSDTVYAWYSDGTRSWGRSWDLDAFGTGTYTPASGKTRDDIVELAIAEVQPGIDRVFTWYRYD